MPVLDVSSLSTPRKLLDSSQFSTPGSSSGRGHWIILDREGRRNNGEKYVVAWDKKTDSEGKETQIEVGFLRGC